MFQVSDAPEMHQELHNPEVPQNSCPAYPLLFRFLLVAPVNTVAVCVFVFGTVVWGEIVWKSVMLSLKL